MRSEAEKFCNFQEAKKAAVVFCQTNHVTMIHPAIWVAQRPYSFLNIPRLYMCVCQADEYYVIASVLYIQEYERSMTKDYLKG